MAIDSLAPELLSSVLFHAAGGQHGYDYDAARDIARMRTLEAASRVCRRWRGIAQPMLAHCVVVRNDYHCGILHDAIDRGNVDAASVRTLVIAPDDDERRYRGLAWARMLADGNEQLSAETRNLMDGEGIKEAMRDAAMQLLAESARTLIADASLLAGALFGLEAVCVASECAGLGVREPWRCRRLVIGSWRSAVDEWLDDDWLAVWGFDTPEEALEREHCMRELVHEDGLFMSLGPETCGRMEKLRLGSMSRIASLWAEFDAPAVRLVSLTVVGWREAGARAYAHFAGLLRQAPGLRRLTFDLTTDSRAQEHIVMLCQAAPSGLDTLHIIYAPLQGLTRSVASEGEDDAGNWVRPRDSVNPLRELSAALRTPGSVPALRRLTVDVGLVRSESLARWTHGWRSLQATCDVRGVTLYREN